MLFDEPNCSECTYLELDRGSDCGKFYCSKHGERHYADEKSCSDYCRAYSRSDRDIKRTEEISKDSQSPSGGCYITTALCNILSMKDDNVYLNTLRSFRKNYLQKNKDGLEILIQYDVVGPKISELLQNDNGRFNMSYILFNNFIVKTVECIKIGDYESAISIYTDMTNRLISFYNIDNTINVTVDEIIPEQAGHGVLRKKPITA